MDLSDPLLNELIIAQVQRHTQALIFAGKGVHPCDRLGDVFHDRRRGDGGGDPAADCGSDGKIRGQYGKV